VLPPRDTLLGSQGVGSSHSVVEQWLELDRLLVLLWESHSICTKVLYYPVNTGEDHSSSCYQSNEGRDSGLGQGKLIMVVLRDGGLRIQEGRDKTCTQVLSNSS